MAFKLLVVVAIFKLVLSLPNPDPDPNIDINVVQEVNIDGCCPGNCCPGDRCKGKAKNDGCIAKNESPKSGKCFLPGDPNIPNWLVQVPSDDCTPRDCCCYVPEKGRGDCFPAKCVSETGKHGNCHGPDYKPLRDPFMIIEESKDCTGDCNCWVEWIPITDSPTEGVCGVGNYINKTCVTGNNECPVVNAKCETGYYCCGAIPVCEPHHCTYQAFDWKPIQKGYCSSGPILRYSNMGPQDCKNGCDCYILGPLMCMANRNSPLEPYKGAQKP